MAYTTIDDPSAYFQTVLYVGNATARSITFDGNTDMQPDLNWTKVRNSGTYHNLADSVRGATKQIYSNASDAEASATDAITSFNSNGFSIGSNGDVNANTKNIVSWNWKAGTSFSNSSGSNGANLDSSGSVSTTAGFSIVSFTGNRSTTRNIYHGLGAVPKMIIFKNRDTTNGWTIYNETIGNANKLTLNSTNASGACTACFASTTPTSTLFTVGDDSDTNGTSNNMIAYCFADVKGYSKVGGSYTGNGNADGTFVYTGFKPAFIIAKRSDGANNWIMHDNKRPEYNPTNILFPNLSNVELSSNNQFDILSNGFKCRASTSDSNTSGGSYIFLAFAESSFVSSSGIPTTAR
jgi:hypothetical protein